MVKVAIIGAGRVGQTLGYLLQRSGHYQVKAVCTRHKTSAQKAASFIGRETIPYTDPLKAVRGTDLVFITTPDRYIEQTCQRIVRAKGFSPKTLVIHCSGNFTSDILSSARPLTARIASLHPLQTFASARESVRHFAGTYCVYEGNRLAQREVIRIIKTIQGVPLKINKSVKPLYHAAGVIASNYLVTLINASINFLIRSGFSKKDALQAIMPLVEGTLKNIRKIGVPQALTGPISRADYSTVQEHLKKIKQSLPFYLPLYKILGRYTVEVAREKGSISKAQAKRIKRLL